MNIIVAEEKHGTAYWDATTPEAWAKSALAILTERWEDGYWYSNPDDDGLGQSEWADKRRAEYAQALAMTKEEIERLPESTKNDVLRLRRQARQDTAYDRQHREWYERAKAVVEAQDAGFETVGRGRYERQVPKAWVLLDERSDHEYERVTLEELATPRPKRVKAAS